MIIQMTFNDNDFTDILFRFSKNMYMNLTDGINMNASREEVRAYNELLNPNIDKKLTDEEKKKIKKRCEKMIEEFIVYCTENGGDLPYLKQSLKVNIINSVEDKWENGEVVYWLQHSGAVVRQ